jgi:DNA-directed RNA polymerase specialized sigma24 family protein
MSGAYGSPAATGKPRGDEGELFARHHAALVRAVRTAVRAPEALIEDACASAWAILLRRQPERSDTLFGWLRTVAIHEAYRLSREQRRTTSLDELGFAGGEPGDAFLKDRRSLDDAVEARRALRVLAALPERQRSTLALKVAGFRYEEIQRLRDDATYTNVNKQLVKARRRIRELETTA